MQLCKKVSDISRFPVPEKLNHPENYAVYNLEGAQDTFYYTEGQFRHGFLNHDKILTPLVYTGYHRGFRINGKDKYLLARMASKTYSPNKLQLLEVETCMPAIPPFAAWILKGNQLAFGIDYESNKRRWGLFDLEKGAITHIPNIETDEITRMMGQE